MARLRQRVGRPLGVLLLTALAAAICGCGSRSRAPIATPGSPPGTVGLRNQPAALGILRSVGPAEVRHAGVRLVEVFDAAGLRTSAHREQVECDGRGAFSLQPLQALTPVAADWELRQRAREGFFFRYRDFEVRDAQLFRQNYDVVEYAQEAEVAGRTCEVFHVVRRDDPPRGYLVWMDEATGLVLRFERLDASGNVRLAVRYETYEADPDLSGAVWFQGSTGELALGLEAPIQAAGGEPAPLPTLLPASFGLLEAFSLSAEGRDWVKLTYTDGAETLFFLHGLPEPLMHTPGGGRRGLDRRTRSAGAATSPMVNVYELGDVRVAQAELEEGTFCAVGNHDAQTLADMIESALP